MSQRVEPLVWNLGIAGLSANLQVQLVDADGVDSGTPLAGVVEISTDGSYQLKATLPANFSGSARLENTSTGEQYAAISITRADADGLTIWQMIAAIAAAVAGKSSGFSGASAATGAKFRSVDDAADRITANTDANGNRTTITLNPPT